MTWRCVRASRYASETLHTPTRTSLCHPPRSPGLPRPHRRRSHRRRAGQARHDSDARPGLRVTPPRERGPRRGNGGRAGEPCTPSGPGHPTRSRECSPWPSTPAPAVRTDRPYRRTQTEGIGPGPRARTELLPWRPRPTKPWARWHQLVRLVRLCQVVQGLPPTQANRHLRQAGWLSLTRLRRSRRGRLACLRDARRSRNLGTT